MEKIGNLEMERWREALPLELSQEFPMSLGDSLHGSELVLKPKAGPLNRFCYPVLVRPATTLKLEWSGG